MTYQAPQRQQAQRSHHVHPLLDTSIQQTQPTAGPAREWVLFSPHASSGAETATISTAHTARTLGHSALSELDSLQTRASRHVAEENGLDEEDETEDLDSLDDGLHAFGVPDRPLQDSDTVLPVHDGLGSFALQEQLWQHERYNPNRRRRPSGARRLSSSPHMRRSTNVGAIVEEDSNREAEQEMWRMRRIEEWRLEQSKAILEEIEKETRRMRRTTSRPETNHSPETMSEEGPAANFPHTQSAPAHSQQPAPADEGFWTRFTRRVIQDLIGIDDATLCYIFGEDVVEEDTQLSSTPRQSDILASLPQRNELELARTDSTWEARLIARIAKELGMLVGQLTEHPGAFSAYQEIQEEHISYAGLTSSVSRQASSPSFVQASMHGTTLPSNSSPFSPDFEPTMRRHEPVAGADFSASQWGVEDPSPAPSHPQHDREHWERELDVKMVFNFIRNRLLRRRTASPSAHRPSTATAQARSYTTNTHPPHERPATASSPTNPARAALIRAHHPLISSPRASAHRSQRRPLSPVVSLQQPLATVLGRRVLSESSCASQSSKRTRTSASVSRSTNYWDWAGPDGVAGWGEV